MTSAVFTGNLIQVHLFLFSDFIWTTNYPSSRDKEATKVFLELLKTPPFATILADKSARKAPLWEGIAYKMENMGYHVACNYQEGAVRCHQKWRNMLRTYNAFIKRPFLSAESAPYYFNDLQLLLATLKQENSNNSYPYYS